MTSDTPADGEGGWADVQHTDPFFSLPTQNPASGALAEALAELRDETTQRWNALDFNGFADPYAGHIATILNAVLSGALIPRPAEPAKEGVNWEQRRWEAMLAAMPTIIVQCANDTREPNERSEQMFARKAVSIANAIIAAAQEGRE